MSVPSPPSEERKRVSEPKPKSDDRTAVSPRRRFRRQRRVRYGPKQNKLPFDLTKALFILPNAFTVSSIFCGMFAILEATHPDAGPDHLFRAALAIFFAGFFDMFDGRVARMTRTQSDFGVQMDSLADAISFGVAPAVLVYKWGLAEIGPWGKIVAFAYAACGVIRLARFNVLEARGEGSSTFFTGLPIPASAAMLVSLVMLHSRTIGTPVEHNMQVLLLVVVLGYLMVSNVRYQTFKTFRPSAKTIPILVAIAATEAAAAYFWSPSAAVVLAIGGYIFYGLVEEVFFFKKWRVSDRVEKEAKADQDAAPKHA